MEISKGMNNPFNDPKFNSNCPTSKICFYYTSSSKNRSINATIVASTNLTNTSNPSQPSIACSNS